MVSLRIERHQNAMAFTNVYTGKMKRLLKYCNGMSCHIMSWRGVAAADECITCVFLDVDWNSVKTLPLIICGEVIKNFQTFDCVTFTMWVSEWVCDCTEHVWVSFSRSPWRKSPRKESCDEKLKCKTAINLHGI